MTNYAAILALSPKHFWPMDETSNASPAADSGSTPTAGAYSGGPQVNKAAMTVNGQSSGPTVVLDGVDDQMTVTPAPGYTTFTVACWFTPTAIQANGVIFNWQIGGVGIPLLIAQDSAITGAGGNANCIGAHVYNGSAWARAQMGSPYAVADQLFIVATVEAGVAVQLFVNGLMRAKTPITTVPVTTTQLRIGRRWDATSHWGKGRVAGVAMWDRVLTASEIAGLVPGLIVPYLEFEPVFPPVDPWLPWGECPPLVDAGPGGPFIGQLWPRGGRPGGGA